MSDDHALREHLRALLTEPQAHATLDDVLRGFPIERRNERVGDLPYSAYEVLWHLRFTQRDLLNFLREKNYTEPKWPADYWPHTQAATAEDWQAQVEAVQADRAELLKVLDRADLFAPVAPGKSQTVLRELLLAADHAAYHTGQLALLRRLLGGGDSAS